MNNIKKVIKPAFELLVGVSEQHSLFSLISTGYTSEAAETGNTSEFGK